MTTRLRLAAFAAALALVVGAGALAGAGLDPLRDPGAARPEHGKMDAGHAAQADAAGAPAGLAIAADGYRLAMESSSFPRGRASELRFRIIDAAGAPLIDPDVEHERAMHLIIVRRDLTGYRHLHPTVDAAGRWATTLRLPDAGAYRVYADFAVAGRSITLAADLLVAGRFAPAPLPAPAAMATSGGYRAELHAAAVRPGRTALLDYDLSRAGRPLAGIQPYLGADGHLVLLREGDLAFVHAHPEESIEPGRISFEAPVPSAGRYRLFLQFKHAGRVRTVAHTLEAS